MQSSPKIESIKIAVYTFPTATRESDGTFEWEKTSLVLVDVVAGGVKGLGYSYTDQATAELIKASPAPKLIGHDALANGAAWRKMVEQIRNLGRPGIASMAIAAVDNALWDLKGQLLKTSVAALLGLVRPSIMAYRSGGFTSYSDSQLREQLGGWAESGLLAVKMKIGRDAVADLDRVPVARQAIGPKTKLFVDANGAYTRKQALDQAYRFKEGDEVTWFDEPVSSDDLEGLRLIRDQGPPDMDIAAGEYGYDSWCFRRMLAARAVDVLQADSTRCAGVTGFLVATRFAKATPCRSLRILLRPFTRTLVCGAHRAINVEYFYDHVRIEKMALEGAIEAKDGYLTPDLSKPGFGLVLKEADVRQYVSYGPESCADRFGV